MKGKERQVSVLGVKLGAARLMTRTSYCCHHRHRQTLQKTGALAEEIQKAATRDRRACIDRQSSPAFAEATTYEQADPTYKPASPAFLRRSLAPHRDRNQHTTDENPSNHTPTRPYCIGRWDENSRLHFWDSHMPSHVPSRKRQDQQKSLNPAIAGPRPRPCDTHTALLIKQQQATNHFADGAPC